MTPDQAYGIAQFLLAHLQGEYKTTRRVLEAVPADRLSYTPDGKCMNAGTLAAHIAATEVMFLKTVIHGEFSGPPTEVMATLQTPAEIVAYYDQVPELLDQAAKLSPDQWTKIIKFFVFEIPAVTILTIDLKHAIHHRGQLSAYLRPMGAKVPAIYGGSADEPFQASAAN